MDEDIALLDAVFWELKQVSDPVLEAHGLNWGTFMELREKVAEAVTWKTLDTEHGTLQVVEKPVWAHTPSRVIQMGTRKSLHFTRRKQ